MSKLLPYKWLMDFGTVILISDIMYYEFYSNIAHYYAALLLKL